jgi:hypothetical protein
MSGLAIRNFADASAAGDVFYNGGVPYSSDGALLVAGVIASAGGIILNGDSLLAKNWNTASSASTPSQTGGVATHNITSSSLLPGMVFHSAGWDDPLWNRDFTALTVAANTVTTEIDPAASVAPGTGDFNPGYVLPQLNALGWFNWCEWTSGNSYGQVVNASRGSRTLAEIAAAFDANVAASTCDVILQGGGTNDSATNEPLANSEAALVSMILRAQRLGKLMILQTVPPRRGKAASQNQSILALNNMIRAKSRFYRLPLVDLYALGVETASLDMQSAYINADGDHQLAAFSQVVAPVLNPILAKYLAYERIAIPITTSDTIGTSTSSNNLIDGFFAGTGGTEAGGATGDTATGWTLTNSSLASCVGSKGTSGTGASQIVTVSAATGQSFTLSLASVHSLIAAGDVLQLVGKIKFNLDIPVRCSFRVAMTPTGGTSGQIRAVQSYAAAEGLPATGTPLTLTFQSLPFTVPAGATYTAANVQVQCNFDATGTGTIECFDFALRALNR